MGNWWDSSSKLGKTAQKVTNIVGGKGITDYVGGRGTKMGLIKGVANVGLSVAGVAGVGKAVGRMAVAKVANKVAPKVVAKVTKKASGKVPTRIAVEGQKAMRVINGWSSKKPGHIANGPKKGPKWR